MWHLWKVGGELLRVFCCGGLGTDSLSCVVCEMYL